MLAIWYTARGAALAAMVMFTVSTAVGALGSLPTTAIERRVVLQYVHRAAALSGLGLAVLHIVLIELDKYSNVALIAIVVPGTSAYRPFAVALGSISVYLLIGVTALGLARGRFTRSAGGVRVWRGLHGLGYLAWAAVIGHSVLSGTDRARGWDVLLTVACVLAVLGAATMRLWHVDDVATPAPRSTPARSTSARRSAPLQGVRR